MTAHRRENWGAGLQGSPRAWRAGAERPECASCSPASQPAGPRDLTPALEPLENVLLVEPLGYAAMARLLGRCALVITDSGGLQEEAPSLDKPVLVTRDSTERTEGVNAGTLRLVGTDPDRIAGEAGLLLDDPGGIRGDGATSRTRTATVAPPSGSSARWST